MHNSATIEMLHDVTTRNEHFNIFKSRLFFNYKTWDVLWVLRSKEKLSLRMPPGNLRWGVKFLLLLMGKYVGDDFPTWGFSIARLYYHRIIDAWVILKSQYRWGGTHVPNFCMVRWMEEILHQLMDGLFMFIPLFIGFQPSKVVQDFFHPQYYPSMISGFVRGSSSSKQHWQKWRLTHARASLLDQHHLLARMTTIENHRNWWV